MNNSPYQFHPSILRQYDLRGIVSKTLLPESARLLAFLLAEQLQQKNLSKQAVVGGDGRLSSPKLKQALIKGLLESGITVLELADVVATPELYHAQHHYQIPLAVMVTGSHNPKEYNGFKIMLAGKPFFGSNITALQNRNLDEFIIRPNGDHQIINLRQQYIADLLKDIQLPKNLKIAWDIGHGALSPAITTLLPKLRSMGLDNHITLYNSIDGNFPAHHPDPTILENLQDLITTVRQEHCDIGFAFDGDGDRIGVVDETGTVLWGDQLLILYSQLLLQRIPNATIIADVKASQVFFDEVTKLGGQAVMAATGHSLIKNQMKKLQSPLAGEMSGHIFFSDRWSGFDDALYAALRLLEVLAITGKSLKTLRQALPVRSNTPEIRLVVKEEEKQPIMQKLIQLLQTAGVKYNPTDGIRAETAKGWWLIRASNTQNCLVLRAEANDKESLKELVTTLQYWLQKAGAPTLPDNYI